jgi:hypothetical protein
LIEFPTLPGQGDARLSALHFGADSQTLAAVWRDRFDEITLSWWDLRRAAQADAAIGANRAEDDFTPPDPALSPDHRFLARMANHPGGVQYVEVVDRADRKRRVRQLTAWAYDDAEGEPEGFNRQVFVAFVFSPDSRHLLAAVAGGDVDDEAADAPRLGVYRWSVQAFVNGRGPKSGGRLLPEAGFFLPMPGPDVFGWAKFGRPLAAAPDGSALAAGLWNNRLVGWRLPEGGPLPAPRLRKRKQPIAWRLAFSPDGRTLAAADETVTFYDTATGKPRATLPPGPNATYETLRPAPFVFDLAYHPSGRLLATACGDAVARWWDATTGAARATFECGVGGVTAVAFSPDGRLCAAGGQGGRVAVWDVGA